MSTRISKGRRAHLIRLCSPIPPPFFLTPWVEVTIAGDRFPLVGSFDYGERNTRKGTYTIDCRPIVLHIHSQGGSMSDLRDFIDSQKVAIR